MAKTRDASLLDDLERLNDEQLKTVRDTIEATLHFREEQNTKLNNIALPHLTKPSLFTPAKNSHDEKKATELLGYVKKADYAAIEKILDTNPTSMFIQVKDTGNKNISPLEFAFKVYDTHTWKMLYEKIKDKPELVEKFTEQAHQQIEHINLKPLFDAYTAYDDQVQRWLKDKITDTQIDADWIQLGKKQRELLPTHMLREFCREGHSWNKTSTFDAKQIHADGRIYNPSFDSYINLESDKFSSGFGSSFSLMRGNALTPILVCVGSRRLRKLWSSGLRESLSGDSATFNRLCEIRKDDLAKQINMLDQYLQQSPTYKK